MDTAWLNKNFPELERIHDDAGKMMPVKKYWPQQS